MGNIIDVGGAGISSAVTTVANFAALPSPPPEGIGAERVTADTGVLYIWDGAAWNAAAGGGAVVSVNGQTGTVNLTYADIGVVPISQGGTGQSNQQAGLNNITDITSHSNGDVLQLLGGNAQFAPLALNLADVSAAIGAPPNSFLFTDATSQVSGFSNWQINPTTFFSNVDNFLHPDNTLGNTNTYSWNINVDPTTNAPNDSMALHYFTVNLDSGATGFQFGTSGQAATLLAGGFNYGGNAASFGTLRHINIFSGFGNGTDPGIFQGFVGSAHGFNVAANITIDGAVHGFDWNLAVNSASISTNNFNVLWLSDFSNVQVETHGYQGIAFQPNILSLANNSNLNAISVGPTVVTMTGNAGFIGYGCYGNFTTLGSSGYQGFAMNPIITTQAANSTISGFNSGGIITTMGANAGVTGYNWNPQITTSHGNLTGINLSPNITGGDGNVNLITGNMNNVNGAPNPSVLSLSGLTDDNLQSQFAADNVHMNVGGTMFPLSAQTIQIQHVLFTAYNQSGAGAVTGTDVLCNVFSPDVNFGTITDSLALGPSGLGFAMVGFAGQLSGHGSMDMLSSVIPTGIFSSDFTLGEWRNVNAYVINAGYSGVCTKATAFYHEVAGAGLFAVDHWGLKVVTDGISNYVPSMQVGGAGTYKTANTSVALGVSGGAFLAPSFDNAGEAALVGVNGMIIYNTDLNKFRGYENGAWSNLI